MSIGSFPAADFTPQLVGYTGQGAFRFWCQKVLPIVYDDSLSYYELLNKVVNYLNNVIKDMSANIENVEKLNDAFVKLQGYVNNYFSSLDVQEEINNKLDDMAESGELGNAVISYIMQMYDWTMPEMFGGRGDGVHDDTDAIQDAINTGKSVLFVGSNYKISETIMLTDNTTLFSKNDSVISRIQDTELGTKYNMFQAGPQLESYPEFNIDQYVPPYNGPRTSNIKISGLTVRGNSFNHSSSGQAVDDGRAAFYLIGVDGFVFENSKIEDVDSTGFYFAFSDDLNIINSAFSKTTSQAGNAYTHTINFRYCSNTKVSGCTFSGLDDGINSIGSYVVESSFSNHIWANNIFIDCYEHGIYCASPYAMISDNAFYNGTGDAIKLRSYDTVVKGNTIVNQDTGISISEPSARCIVDSNVIELFNTVKDTIIGIAVTAQTLATIISNRNKFYFGLTENSRMVDNKITNNIIRLSGAYTNIHAVYGIRVLGSADYTDRDDAGVMRTTIVGNTIEGFPNGICFFRVSTKNIVSRNRLKCCETLKTPEGDYPYYGSGISFLVSTQFDSYFDNNYIDGFKYGVYRNAGTGNFNSFSYNTIVNCLLYAFYFETGTLGSAMDFVFNELRDNGKGDSSLTFTDFNLRPSTAYFNSDYDSRKNYGYVVRKSHPPTEDAVPGTWRKGDWIRNINGQIYDPLFWVCADPGSPGFWVPFGGPYLKMPAPPVDERLWPVGTVVWNSEPGETGAIGWICIQQKTTAADGVWREIV